MIASRTSAFIHQSLPPYDGVVALANSQAMDVETDGQRLAESQQHNDPMDITIDSEQNAPDENSGTDTRSEEIPPDTKTDIPAITEPSPVFERPREGGNDTARNSPIQIRKTPH